MPLMKYFLRGLLLAIINMILAVFYAPVLIAMTDTIMLLIWAIIVIIVNGFVATMVVKKV